MSAVALALALVVPGAGAAEAPPVGSVLFAKGAVTAQAAGGDLRFLAKGEQLYRGDVLSTGARSFAVLRMSDDARMTLRPNTVLRLEEYATREREESALLRLFKGGLRALTGLIGKRRPAGYRVQTAVATIGVRGTEFDVRLCAGDCPDAMADPAGSAARPVAGRVLIVRGTVTAQSRDAAPRALPKGAPVHEGDTVETAPASFAVLVFRDDTRVTLRPETRFEVERYPAATDSAGGNVLLRLVRGGLRALTGLIGRTRPSAFQVRTPVATIGVRGTGFDLDCRGACAEGTAAPVEAGDQPDCAGLDLPAGPPPKGPGDGLLVYTWDGAVDLRLARCRLAVAAGQAAYARPDGGAARFEEVPGFLRDNPDPRPDGVDVDLESLFGAAEHEHPAEGMYVSVYDGVVFLETDAGVLDVGRGESGYAGTRGEAPVRLARQPFFQTGDPLPKPSEYDDRMERMLNLLGEEIGGGALECKVR